MKHLFLVHSHITYLVACAVVRHEGLQADHVVLLLGRGYEPPETVHRSAEFPVKEPAVPLLCLPFQRWRNRQNLRRFLAKWGKEPVHWYLPHTAFSFFAALIRHAHTEGFSLIEEGLGSYFTAQEINALLTRRMRPVSRLLMRLSGRQVQFADHRYQAAYGCTDAAYPGYERKVRVTLAPPTGTAPRGTRAIVAFDYVLESRLASESAFYKCVHEMVARIAADGHDQASYKLHPEQLHQSRHTPRLRSLLQDNAAGVRFTELPAGTCLEGLAAAGQRDFYIFGSSVGFYAAASGCRVVSMARRLAALDPLYRRTMESLPAEVVASFEFV